MIIRVFYNPDGTIADILQPGSGRDPDDCTKKAGYEHLEYDDMDMADLPKGKGTRGKLRGEKGKGVWIDETFETKDEVVAILKQKLDDELDAKNADPIKAMRLQRDIERLQKETWRTRKKT